jgi:hypothetical protein
MRIGYLGDILFRVNSDVVKTPNNVQWSGSARYADHQRHLKNSLTEFIGIDSDTFTFDMVLTVELGVNVMEELVKIWSYERKGIALPLVLCEKIYGKYRWTIQKHKIRMQYFDSKGNVSTAYVSINLLEYVTTEM